jgi:hypothetical protein
VSPHGRDDERSGRPGAGGDAGTGSVERVAEPSRRVDGDDDGPSSGEGTADDGADARSDADPADAGPVVAVDLNRRANVTGGDPERRRWRPGGGGAVAGVATVLPLSAVDAAVTGGTTSVAFAVDPGLLTVSPAANVATSVAFATSASRPITGSYDGLLGCETPRSVGDAAVGLVGVLAGAGGATTLVAAAPVAAGTAYVGTPIGAVAGTLGAGLVGGCFGVGTGFLREDLTVDDDPDRRGPRRDRTEFVAHANGLIVRRSDARSDHVAWADVAGIERGPEAIHLRRRDGPDLAPAVADVDDPDAVVRRWRRLAARDDERDPTRRG